MTMSWLTLSGCSPPRGLSPIPTVPTMGSWQQRIAAHSVKCLTEERNEKKMKVLIAEDDPISRRRLERILVAWGYGVTAAGDGIRALQVFREQDPPPLAILDWVMPGMDGTEVCRKIREMPNHMSPYIILLATKDFLGAIIDRSKKGADDYMAKPFDFDELRARLQNGMRVINLRRELASKPSATL